ncbi:MAG: hypothetical protein ACUVRO_13405 [Armatimonadota bacterium]
MARRHIRQTGQYLRKSVGPFFGGLHTEHPATIDEGELAVAENVEITPTGGIKPRPGVLKRYGTDFAPFAVKGIAPYYKSDGTTRLVAAAGTTLYTDEPHVSFVYDSQAEWEKSGVYTNLDTETSPGDVKLPTPPQAVFQSMRGATYAFMWF